MGYRPHRSDFLNSDLIWTVVSNIEQEYINMYFIIEYTLLRICCSCRKKFHYRMDGLVRNNVEKKRWFLSKQSICLEYVGFVL